MLYMIIERFRDGNAIPVYRRFRDRGRLASDELRYVASWVTADLERCYQIMECDNRALLDAFLDSRPDLECFRPPAGTVAFPRLTQSDPEKFFKLLREKYETSVVPGRNFEMPQHFRIGIGGDTASLRGGLERLSAALDEFKKRL